MTSCPYKYALGIPGEGVHARRFLGFAIFDWIATFIVAGITSYLTNTNYTINLLGWVVAGEALHYIFGTPTAFLKMIGLTPTC